MLMVSCMTPRISCRHVAGLSALIFLAPGFAQRPAATAPAARRALLINNRNYSRIPGNGVPIHDTQPVAAALGKLGFQVDQASNLNISALSAALRDFTAKVQNGDIVFVYFSGLAVQANQENYLLPTDFAPNDSDLFSAAYSVSKIDADLVARHPAARVLVLDACDSIPALENKFDPGLAFPQLEAPGVLVALAAQPGKASARSDSASLFPAKLAEALEIPGLTLQEVFQKLQNDVRAATSGAQIPTYIPLALNPVYLAGAPKPAVVAAAPSEPKGPTPVLIRLFTVAKGVTVPDKLTQDLAVELGHQIASWGRFEISVDSDPQAKKPEPKTGLILEGEVISYKGGSRAARAFIGYGVGSTTMTARSVFIDAATGKVVYKSPECKGFVKGGATGGSTADVVRYLAQALLIQASKDHAL